MMAQGIQTRLNASDAKATLSNEAMLPELIF